MSNQFKLTQEQIDKYAEALDIGYSYEDVFNEIAELAINSRVPEPADTGGAEEMEDHFICSLLHELYSKHGVDTSNWDGDEGSIGTLAKCIIIDRDTYAAQRCAEKDREIANLEAALSESMEVKVSRVLAEAGKYEVDLEHPMFIAFIQTIIGVFKAAGAINYYAMKCVSNQEMYDFIIQRSEGKTPADIVGELRSELSEANKRITELETALNIIKFWITPETGKFWDKEQTQPTSYETEYGSNGARDYMRNIAAEALKTK